MTVSSRLDQLVRDRAGDRCEYCQMHQSLQGGTFHIEHIVPQATGGDSIASNLALACPSCNLHKSDKTEAIDPESGAVVRLFDPRQDDWNDHFRWDRYAVVPMTDIGRVTSKLLDFNGVRRIKIRRAEELFGLFPPE